MKLTKDAFFRLFLNLILEKKEGEWVLSIGRTSWWAVFGVAMKILAAGNGSDITSNHLTILLILATYNFGKHVLVKKFDKPPEQPDE